MIQTLSLPRGEQIEIIRDLSSLRTAESIEHRLNFMGVIKLRYEMGNKSTSPLDFGEFCLRKIAGQGFLDDGLISEKDNYPDTEAVFTTEVSEFYTSLNKFIKDRSKTNFINLVLEFGDVLYWKSLLLTCIETAEKLELDPVKIDQLKSCCPNLEKIIAGMIRAVQINIPLMDSGVVKIIAMLTGIAKAEVRAKNFQLRSMLKKTDPQFHPKIKTPAEEYSVAEEVIDNFFADFVSVELVALLAKES